MSETSHASTETPAESAGNTGLVRRKPKPNKRRALTRVDHRYQLGRRALELERLFADRIPDAADPVVSVSIRRAAETIALSEDLRARALRGESISPDDVLRSSRTADLMTRRLHLDRRKPAAVGLCRSISLRTSLQHRYSPDQRVADPPRRSEDRRRRDLGARGAQLGRRRRRSAHWKILVHRECARLDSATTRRATSST